MHYSLLLSFSLRIFSLFCQLQNVHCHNSAPLVFIRIALCVCHVFELLLDYNIVKLGES